MKRILIQGDSITDCGRNRNDFFLWVTDTLILLRRPWD